jgi:hypothetical protein
MVFCLNVVEPEYSLAFMIGHSPFPVVYGSLYFSYKMRLTQP